MLAREEIIELKRVVMDQVDNLRINYGEKLTARYLLTLGLEVAVHPCIFEARLEHPITGIENNYAHKPDFAVRNPRRPNGSWGFLEVTITSERRLPRTYDGTCAPSANKFKQLAVMETCEEKRYAQVGLEGLQRWARRIEGR